MSKRYLAASLLIATAALAGPPTTAPSLTLGVNTGFPVDWNAPQHFADLMKQARGWGASGASWGNESGPCATPGCSVGSPANVDASGWPNGDFSVVFASAPVPLGGGVYKLQFNGSATLAPVGANVSIANQTYNAGTNTTTADVVLPLGGAGVAWTASNPYVVGYRVTNSSNVYECIAAGTSAGATGPTGTGTSITDGSVTWTYLSAANDGNIGLFFTATKKTNPSATNTGISNLSLMRPGHVLGTDVFNKAFLRKLAPFSVIRTMDTTQANGTNFSANPQVNWTDRCLPTHPSQQVCDVQTTSNPNKGISWEYVAQMATIAGKDLWINVPHRAAPAYWTSLAQLMQAQLSANSILYVEYGNEIWNGAFAAYNENKWAAVAESMTPVPAWAPTTAYSQNHVVQNGGNVYACITAGTSAGSGGPSGTSSNITDGGAHWSFVYYTAGADTLAMPGEPTATLADTLSNADTWAQRRVARQLKGISDAFLAVFGSSSLGPRIRPVLATQVANVSIAQNALAWIDQKYGTPSRFFWGGAGTAYFATQVDSASFTLNQLLGGGGAPSQMLADIDGQAELTKPQITVFSHYGLNYAQYEGGPGLVGGAGSLATKIAANRDPRMNALMQYNYRVQQALGVALSIQFDIAFNYGSSGMWGVYEDVNVNSVKHPAMMEPANLYSLAHLIGRPRIGAPQQIDARSYSQITPGSSLGTITDPSQGGPYIFMNAPAGGGPGAKYYFTAQGFGYMKLVVHYFNQGSTVVNGLIVTVNDQLVGSVTLYSGTSTAGADAAAIYIPVQAGANSIELAEPGSQATASATNNLVFSAAFKTITRQTGSFVTDRFIVGQNVFTSGFANGGNNGTFLVGNVTPTVLTLVDSTAHVDETAVATALVRGEGGVRYQYFTISDM